jgi:hypothetical protein
MRMRHVILSSVWYLWLYHIFSQYLINAKFFGINVIEHKICILNFATNLFCNISHSKKNSARYSKKIYVGFRVNYPLFLPDLNGNLFSL